VLYTLLVQIDVFAESLNTKAFSMLLFLNITVAVSPLYPLFFEPIHQVEKYSVQEGDDRMRNPGPPYACPVVPVENEKV